MRYRDHRGGLQESLETMIEVDSKDQLITHLKEIWNIIGKEVGEIKFEHVGMDDRIGWDTYYVLLRFKGKDKFFVVGMSDGKFPEEEKK